VASILALSAPFQPTCERPNCGNWEFLSLSGAQHAALGAIAAPQLTREGTMSDGAGRQNTGVNLGRIAWLVTVVACLIAVLVLALEGYIGYAGVTLAVAISAAFNLV
jgi:hypothetical protein